MAKKTILTSTDITSLISAMKVVFPTRDEVRDIVREEIKFLPTKDDFYTRMDKLSGEIQKVHYERELHAGQHNSINDRFERVDKHLGVSTAP